MSFGLVQFFLINSEDSHLHVVDAVNSLGIPGVSAPTGTPGAGQSVQYYFKYDTTKAHTVLGIETRDLVTTAKDMVEEFHQRGWISK